MKAEYKRDSGRNYLIIHEETGIGEGSYQIRMLTGNSMKRVLPCHIRRLDGEMLLCFDVTSKQNIQTFYEGKKVCGRDLFLIFAGCVKILEEMNEYLLPQEQLILDPEYIYLEAEKRNLFFCCLPGYTKEIGQQFRELMEYLLPRIDHDDRAGVELGYGIYRKAMGDGIPLEEIREALSRYERNAPAEEMTGKAFSWGAGNYSRRPEEETEDGITGSGIEGSGQMGESGETGKIKRTERITEAGEAEGENKAGRYIPALLSGTGLLVLLFGWLFLKDRGYLLWLTGDYVLGGTLFLAAAVLLMRKAGKSILEKRKREDGKEAEQEEVLTEPASFEGYEEDPGPLTEYRQGSSQAYAEPEEENEEDPEEYGETMMLYKEPVRRSPFLRGEGEEEGQSFLLDREVMVVGKLKGTADICISSPSVSRIHARIRRKKGDYYLSDLNSRNGTFRNGELLEAGKEVCLKNEDRLRFAEAEYVFLDQP